MYKQPLWNVILVLVFLCLSCNQKPTQKAEIPGETDEHDHGTSSPPMIVSVLGKQGAPAILSGSGALYLAAAKAGDPHINDWEICSVQEGPVHDANYCGNLGNSTAPQFVKDEATNQFGLYFGDFQTKTRVSVCGTEECKPQFVNLEMLIIKSSPQQFSKLFDQAQEINPKISSSVEWDLYFLDPKFQNFHSDQFAKLNLLSPEGDNPEVEWNGLFNNNEKNSLAKDAKAPLQVKWTKLGNRELMVGKYSEDGKTYPIIGVKQLQLIRN